MKIAPLAVGRRVAALAARQHGVVAARQLIALGLAQQTIADWVAAGRLHRVHRGVYAVGHSVLAFAVTGRPRSSPPALARR